MENRTPGPAVLSNLEIDSDGTVTVAIEVETSITNFGCDSSITSEPFTSALSLLQLKPDGSTSNTVIRTNTEDEVTAQTGRLPRAWPWKAIPDGQGGFLVAWTDYSIQQPPDYITHISASGQNDYPFPSLFQTISSMVLGDNGAAYATDSQTIQAFDISTGQPLWTYISQALDGIAIIASSAGGGLVAKEFLGFRQETVLRFDSTGQPTYDGTGNATPAPSFGSFLQATWKGQWIALLNAASARIALPSIPVTWTNDWAEPGGNSSETGQAVTHHSFGLFWCGIGVALQGYLGPCIQANGNDIQWGYYPNASGISGLQIFAADHPDWVGMIESEAINSFRKAYTQYGIQVTLATQTNGVPDQEFTAFVLGDYPFSTAGQRFLNTSYSGVYYFYYMENAQTALGQPQLPNGGGWINYSPSYPPQDTPKFVELLRAMGRAIGNAAAHEMGHHLELINTIKSNNYQGLPYMDCGLGNPGDKNRPVPIACEGNDNFVYGFYTPDGFPQDPNNPYSTGGMFFYGVIGGQLGVPVQPPIHWGPSEVCWLERYAGLNCEK